MAAWTEAADTGSFSIDHRVRRGADDVYRWFQTRARPVRDEAGRISEWLGTSSDIEDQVRARQVMTRHREELEAVVTERTAALQQALDALQAEIREREQAEDALRQAQKMEAVGQLTGGIAHDFNNMLQGIAGSLDMVERRIGNGRAADVLRYLESARNGVERAAGLTRRLLAFARRQRLQPRLLDPDALVAGMANLIRRTMGPAIRLELLLRDGVARVLCDPGELESALLNLCINARDAMPDGGQLKINTEDVQLTENDTIGHDQAAPGLYVAVAVADTGHGMSQQVMARAFEPFFTTKALGQGTGLGLSQVFGFVRQSGGIVQLRDTPGRGTLVQICLPAREGADLSEQQAAARSPEEGSGAGNVVLLVDDENDVRGLAAERLRELRFRVLEAPDGPAALRLLDRGAHVDVLVTDVGLPGGMNGRQVAEAVHERLPDLPVLFITGYASTALPEGCEAMSKPFELNALARRIQALVRDA